MKTDRKPPLARSPMTLRGRRPLQPPNSNFNANTPIRTPAMMSKPQMREQENRPELNTVSCELRALAKMVEDELGAINAKNNNGFGSVSSIGGGNTTMFERGSLYNAYSERRNERLRKKLSESWEDEPKTAYNHLGVKVDSTLKKDSTKKKAETLKKSMMAAATTYSSVDRSQHPRYALRSTTKKPPLPVAPMNIDDKGTARKTPSTRARRK
ncbi:hypothetical protein SOVF_183920 [Spinacia oleracea]|uniref:Uncharacterized protein n=1 Tax=Spinacia oleracea TaxID=3562 RepID=A0A9R0ILZ8_SPIOL|nr:uncharacterized protein LOC110790504 [Spinacia oleracea]KNA06125.1 hypothetical protein SOVF_183920 [Spinacia oleracea]